MRRYQPHYVDDVVQACQEYHAPILWDVFAIPVELLKATPTAQSSPILHVSLEILAMIYEHADPLSNVCLALSCKSLLLASTVTELRIPSAAKHRIHPAPSCTGMCSLLNLVAPVRRSRAKPPGVCYRCFRLRPTLQSHWKPVRAKFSKHEHLSVSYVSDRIQMWGCGYSTDCPECTHLRGYPWLTMKKPWFFSNNHG
ncbi:hypothetical protein F5Y04DRAFT_210024 [Hypomontagnella monticulosa]|nr:hypothetical protein F5Y04DRAFT_210024 [Hypomontagnella monticulosa]